MPKRFLFTSESVTEGHPDKVADQVSDGILDAVLAEDPQGRVACETLTSNSLLFVAGEITTTASLKVPEVAREVVREIGYTHADYGLDADTCAVLAALNPQSPDIAQGVSLGDDQLGAGDQGLMFGYASNDTPELMPLPIQLAHRLARRLAEVRKNGTVKDLRPDGKSQVTVRFEDGKPVHADAVVIATQHDDALSTENVRAEVKRHVIEPVIEEYVDADFLPETFLDASTQFYINHTGRFVKGGPAADAGLTGRKIIVDTYGGWAPHGGGAFSGKDPTKVDRSAAYGARWAAKNVVEAGLAEKCQIQLGYSIGHHQPLGIFIDTFGTGVIPDEDLEQAVRQVFDFSPAGLIKALDLRRPIYRQTAAYGHFGRADLDLPWERTDRVAELQRSAGKK